jgi:hypothetical protein
MPAPVNQRSLVFQSCRSDGPAQPWAAAGSNPVTRTIKSPEIERFQGFFLRFCGEIAPKSWILKKRQKVFPYYFPYLSMA